MILLRGPYLLLRCPYYESLLWSMMGFHHLELKHFTFSLPLIVISQKNISEVKKGDPKLLNDLKM